MNFTNCKANVKFRQNQFEEDGLVFLKNTTTVRRNLSRELLYKIHGEQFGMKKHNSRAIQKFCSPRILDNMLNVLYVRNLDDKIIEKHSILVKFFHYLLKEKGVMFVNLRNKYYLTLVIYLTKWLEIVPIVN